MSRRSRRAGAAHPAVAALGRHRPAHGRLHRRHRRDGGHRAGDGVMDDPRIVIIGAGPTGLGAGYRLQELGHDDWVILEANDYVGGLATSFTDDKGFTYDIGGDVMFSPNPPYHQRVGERLGGEFTPR